VVTTDHIIRAAKVRGIGQKKKRKSKKWAGAANLGDFGGMDVPGARAHAFGGYLRELSALEGDF
jgi:hypothetical protein